MTFAHSQGRLAMFLVTAGLLAATGAAQAQVETCGSGTSQINDLAAVSAGN
jgi:hypothetical protein